ILMLRPSLYPRSRKPLRSAARLRAAVATESGDMTPITGIAACCARAVIGHAAAAPPSAASNSRRLIVTVIRPSRARCVKGTIPRHERAVLIQAGGGGAALATKCTQHAGRSASTLKRAFARRRGLFSSDRASGSTLIFGCRQQAGVKKPKQLAARDTRTQGQA